MKIIIAISLLFQSINLFAYEWTGEFSFKELNGQSMVAEIQGTKIVAFVENEKIYSNVVSKEGCDFAIGIGLAGGSGDKNIRYIFTEIIGKNVNGETVKFEIGLSESVESKKYNIIKLNRVTLGIKENVPN